MKKAIFILSVLGLLFTTACKKSTLIKKMNNTTWELKQILNGDEDVTASVIKTQAIYLSLEYSNDGNGVTLSNPNREELENEDGTWTLEKIVPTSGDKYYLIRNTIEYKYGRTEVFNVNDYGSEMRLSEEDVLTQYIDDYTLTYEKVN